MNSPSSTRFNSLGAADPTVGTRPAGEVPDGTDVASAGAAGLAGAARSDGTDGADPEARQFVRRGQAARASIAPEVAAQAVVARAPIAQEVAAVAAEAIAPEGVVAEEVAAVAATAPEAIHQADASEADRDLPSRVVASSR